MDKVFYIIPFLIIWFIIYKVRNSEAKIEDIIMSVQGFVFLVVIFLFISVSIDLIKYSIESSKYIILIIPIVFLIVCYINLKKILTNYFNINIRIINSNFDITYDKAFLTKFLFILFFVVIFNFITAITILKVLPDVQNQNFGVLPILIVILIFGYIAIGSLLLLFKVINDKFKLCKFNKKVLINRNKIIGFTFAFLGLMFVMIGLIIFYQINSLRFDGIKTEGTINRIICINGSCSVEVKYLVNNQEVVSDLKYFDSTMKEGKKVTVYYEQQNIKNFIIVSFPSNYFPLFYSVIALPFILIGIRMIKK